ncbi:MAG: oligosaccharide flippase family protein, partial [Pseudomonadota bacterium]
MSYGPIRRVRSWSIKTVSDRLIGWRASFTGDAIISLAGGSLARAITLASMPFVTRIYSPADVGVWAIVLTLAGFLVPLANLRYDVAIVIALTQRTAAAIALAIGVCMLAVAVALAAALSVAPKQLLEAISGLGPDKQGLLAVVPLLLVLLAAQATLQAWLTRERQFGALSLAQLIQAIVTAAAMLLLPLIAGASAGVATAAAMLGLAMGITVTAWAGGAQILSYADRRLAHAVRTGLRRYKVYPLYFVPYSLSAGLAERILQLVLAGAYSISALGAFYVARQLVTAPATLLSATLCQVM